MTGRACKDCEWCADQSDVRGTCREGPVPVPVHLDHWCGRFRMSEQAIRSGARLAPAAILEHFRAEDPA